MHKSKNYATQRNLSQMLYAIKKVYNQLVAFYLVDKDKNAWYDNAPHMGGGTFPGYTGILECFQKLSNDFFINIHSLNHDLFFERLQHTDWLFRKISDGFQELGSPFYGDLKSDGRVYKCRLERYTGIYDKTIRLYKLHGSKDYCLYYRSNGSVEAVPEIYIKTRYSIGYSDFYREVANKNGELSYEKCWINYHADFLTGTTSKIERYNEPLLFEQLFKLIRTNLKEAESLLIIGYGAKDSEVNKSLEKILTTPKSEYLSLIHMLARLSLNCKNN